MNRLRTTRRPSLLAALIACLSLAGCAINEGPQALRALGLPAGGSRASADWWAAARPYAGEYAERVGMAPFPTWLSVDSLDVDEGGALATGRRFRLLNLGLLAVPWLPLWISNDIRIVREGETTSAGRVDWSPLWASSSRTAWHGDDPWVTVRGMPLFYGRVDYGLPGEDPTFRMHNVLWSLGPAWGWFEDSPGSIDAADGWFLAPVLAGGFGLIAWTSLERDTADLDLSIHGPAFGSLGYLSIEDREAGESLRMVATGALWLDYSESDPDGAVRDSLHGPLWGMFGWGRWDGRPAIRLFWIPIRF